MILRALRLQHGRLALPRTITPITPQYRFSSTEAEGSASSERLETPVFLEPSATQASLDAIPNVRSVKINDPTHPVAQDYVFFQHQKAHTQHLGSSIAPHYKPHMLLLKPPSPKDITLELLLASQAHIGHATALWHPANARYIFGIRGRKAQGESPIHIISLDATAAHLRRACKVVSGVTERGGLVLFVGTRAGHARAVVRAAQLAQGCHLFTKWIPGSITNGQQILGRCTKKVVNELDEEVDGFEEQLLTSAALKPDLVVCLNPRENYVLLQECAQNNIPTIGIIDTDSNPTWVTYPIPANDDSLRCVQVIAGALARAGEEGQKTRLRLARENIVTYAAAQGLRPPRSGTTRKAGPQRQQRAKPEPHRSAPAVTEPAYPEDLEGVEVQQHERDQEILDEAEQVIFGEQGAPSSLDAAGSEADSSDLRTRTTLAAPVEEEEGEYEEEGRRAGLGGKEDLDPSLLDDSYGSRLHEDLAQEEDLAQFGGAEQLLRPAADDADAEVESTWDQVGAVEKELGEDDPHADVPSGNPDVAATPEQGTEQQATKEDGERKGR